MYVFMYVCEVCIIYGGVSLRNSLIECVSVDEATAAAEAMSMCYLLSEEHEEKLQSIKYVCMYACMFVCMYVCMYAMYMVIVNKSRNFANELILFSVEKYIHTYSTYIHTYF